MNQKERREYLINFLIKDSLYYNHLSLPENEIEQKQILRALMNVREPRPLPKEFFKIQDEYLQEELLKENITDVKDLNSVFFDKRMYLWQGDITTLKADAIVNAANCKMLGCFVPGHNCIDNIIGYKAGLGLRKYMNNIMEKQGRDEETGKAKISPGFNLPAKHIIHTVGPIVSGILTKKHEELLKSCYQSCLELASFYNLESIVFCCISTGEFHFPNKIAAKIAVETCKEYLDNNDTSIKRVVFNVFKDLDLEIYDALLNN